MMAMAAVVVTACNDDDDDMNTPPVNNEDPTLYEQFGGDEMVQDPVNGGMIERGYLTLRSVTDSSLFVIAGDPRLSPYFGPLLSEVGSGDLSGFSALSATFTDFLANAAGDDRAYNGLNMVDAHKIGTNNRNQFLVNNAAYDAFIEDVVAGAGQNGVPGDDPRVAAVGELLESLRSQIVQTTASVEEQTLYTALGGDEMVDDPANQGQMIERGYLTLRSVVDSTIFVIAGDDRLNEEYFSVLLNEVGNNDLSGFAALSKGLTDFFAYATGSTNPDHYYTGLNMVDAHNPSVNSRMGNLSDDAAYDAFIEDVVAGAGQNNVPSDDPIVAALGGFLESLRGDIVQR